MSVTEFLERAKRHEDQESWGEALYSYERAIERLQDEGKPDPELFSRVGDLQFRLKQPKQAAASYEKSVDLYVSKSNLDGAFAVCQKILRHLPDLEEVYLRIARIRAMQGYTEWARQHYLTYAQLKGARGDREAAIKALEELIGVVPADIDTRLFVAERLVAAGRTSHAIAHLRDGYDRAFAGQDRKGAERLRDRMSELDPQAPLAELPEPARPEEALAEGGFGARVASREKKSGSLARFLGALGLRRSSMRTDAGAAGEEAANEPFWWREETVEAHFANPSKYPTELERRLAEAREEHGAAALEEAAVETPGLQEDARWDTPWNEPRPVHEAAVPEAAVHQAWEATEAPPFEAPPTYEPPPAYEPPPTYQPPPSYEPPVYDPPSAYELPVAEPVKPEAPEPEEPEPDNLHLSTANAARREGKVFYAPPVRDPAQAPAPAGEPEPEPEPAAADDPLAAEEAEVLKLLADEPFEVKHHERFCRYAAKRGERDLLVEGLFHMAIALRASGLEWRAKSTLARIMSMEPNNARALEALGYGKPGAEADPFLRGAVAEPAARPAATAAVAAPAPVQPAPTFPAELFETGAKTEARPEPDASPDGGYIDLAALILDEPVEHTTRWNVEYKEPAHNEEADFGEILAQFKQHVSQHLERSDARAHYDLGSAYKGMGLVQEAIAMFQKALRAEPDFLPAIEMLGRCFIENGDIDAGIKVLSRGLQVTVPVEDDLLGIYYYLGNAHETQGHKDAAKDFYMRVFACDINFIDVTDRLRALRS